MTKLTDTELQALVYQTGITPVDKLPKPDPKAELVSFLHQVSVSINGAAKAGNPSVMTESSGFPTYSKETVIAAQGVLEQLGYRVGKSECGTSVRLTVSGWL